MAIKQMVLNQKLLSGSELAKVQASQAIQQAKRKEQEAKRVTGADKVESEADKAVATHHAVDLDTVHTLHPALLAKVSKGQKLTTNEQKELANFFKSVGWL